MSESPGGKHPEYFCVLCVEKIFFTVAPMCPRRSPGQRRPFSAGYLLCARVGPAGRGAACRRGERAQRHVRGGVRLCTRIHKCHYVRVCDVCVCERFQNSKYRAQIVTAAGALDFFRLGKLASIASPHSPESLLTFRRMRMYPFSPHFGPQLFFTSQ